MAEGLTVNSYEVTGLVDGQYYFVIVAYNNYGQSISNCESIVIQNPPIGVVIFLIIIIAMVIAVSLMLYLRSSKLKARALREKESELLVLKNDITEDDIKIAKERRICLVHKGPITGFSFICPECGAIYCQKCVEAIQEIENTCWSCNTSLDPTKPSKAIKKKEVTEDIIEDDGKDEDITHKKSPKEEILKKGISKDNKKTSKPS